MRQTTGRRREAARFGVLAVAGVIRRMMRFYGNAINLSDGLAGNPTVGKVHNLSYTKDCEIFRLLGFPPKRIRFPAKTWKSELNSTNFVVHFAS